MSHVSSKFWTSSHELCFNVNKDQVLSMYVVPGNDPMGYESSNERWSPVQSIEKVSNV